MPVFSNFTKGVNGKFSHGRSCKKTTQSFCSGSAIRNASTDVFQFYKMFIISHFFFFPDLFPTVWIFPTVLNNRRYVYFWNRENHPPVKRKTKRIFTSCAKRILRSYFDDNTIRRQLPDLFNLPVCDGNAPLGRIGPLMHTVRPRQAVPHSVDCDIAAGRNTKTFCSFLFT